MQRKTRAQERAEAIDLSPTTLLAEIERITGEREAALREKEEFLVALQRERAEFTNYKRRTAEERQAMIGLAGEALINKVLTVADDFDRAIEAQPVHITGDPWTEGITAIDRKLRGILESEGVSPIEAEPGTPFDPREHEAVVGVPDTEYPDGTIVMEVRRGYRLRDRVLRPALVAVADDRVSSAGPTNPADAGASPADAGASPADAGASSSAAGASTRDPDASPPGRAGFHTDQPIH